MDTVNLDLLPLPKEQLRILEQILNQHESRDELVLVE
jgi:hypothetical protein